MRNVMIVVLALVVFWAGFYFICIAESDAYAAYQVFDDHRLRLRYDACEAMASSDQVLDYFKTLRRRQKKMGESRWYQYMHLSHGPFRKLRDESTGPDGRVTLKISQEILRGPPEAVTFGPMNVREVHEAVLVETESGWKVDHLVIEEEILHPLPPEFRDWE